MCDVCSNYNGIGTVLRLESVKSASAKTVVGSLSFDIVLQRNVGRGLRVPWVQCSFLSDSYRFDSHLQICNALDTSIVVVVETRQNYKHRSASRVVHTSEIG